MLRRTLPWIAACLVAACRTPPVTEATLEPTVAPSETAEPTMSATSTATPSATPTATVTATPTPGPSLEELMGTPNALAAAANLEAASVAFSDLVDLYPNRAEPWLGLAGLAQRQGDLAQAHDYLVAAFDADPTNQDSNRQLALLLELLGRYEEASEVYFRMIALDPDNPNLYIARAIAYARTNHSAEAIADLQSAQALDPYLQYAWLNVAAAASGQRHYQAAEQIAAAGLAAHPESVGLYLARGLARLSLDLPEEALEDFTAATEINELSYTAFHWRGRALAALGRVEDAIADLQRAGELGILTGVEGVNEGYEAMADAADLMAQTGRVDEAYAYIADQVISHGSQDALMLAYARIEYRRGNTELALGRLTALMRDGYMPAFYWRGVINSEDGNREDAIDDLSSYLLVQRSGPDAEAARDALAALGADPDAIITPTPTATPVPNPGFGDGD
jgi:tetratricopeptide (TPR) repeat protein